LLVTPVLLGRVPTVFCLTALGIACFVEYTRAAGIAHRKPAIAAAVSAIIANGAVVYVQKSFWVYWVCATLGLLLVTISMCPRSGSGARGSNRLVPTLAVHALCGTCLLHLGFLARHNDCRALLLLLFACVELNDVAAYCCGRIAGKHLLASKLSPRKTIEGAVGALAVTTTVFVVAGRVLFSGTPAGATRHLLAMGLSLSATAQAGDLMISAVKRSLGRKDMGTIIPGHGGLLDRFDSLLPVGPVLCLYLVAACDVVF